MSIIKHLDNPMSGEKFLLEIDDGTDAPCWVKSVSGMDIQGGNSNESYSVHAGAFNQLTGKFKITPLDIEIGMAAAWPMLSWIEDSWARRSSSRRNGSIVRTNLHYEINKEYWFDRALIEEVTFPPLDSSDAKSAYLKCKIRPEGAHMIKQGGGKVQSTVEERQRLWSPSQFRISIDDMDCTRVQKIGSISVKQSIGEVQPGIESSPRIEPTRIEFPMLTLTMPESGAQTFFEWYEQAVFKGMNAPAVERTATLEYLDQSRTSTLFSIKMEGVNIHGLKYSKAEGQSKTLQMVDVELYVDTWELERDLGMTREDQAMRR